MASLHECALLGTVQVNAPPLGWDWSPSPGTPASSRYIADNTKAVRSADEQYVVVRGLLTDQDRIPAVT
ncbi:MAG: hypothetical protein NT074_01440 [Methanomicrobiales archaeon]|jgi:hypothetical protein|nr:hypothetical protein [Methanomicrobiales archaeon]